MPPSALLLPSSAPHLSDTPNRTLWLDELRLESFDEHVKLLADPASLAERAAAAYSDGPGTRSVFVDLIDRYGDNDAVRLNLLLVAAFMEKKRSAAVAYVAEDRLPIEIAGRFRTDQGRMRVLPVAAYLYAIDPKHLLSISLWDEWHSRARATYRLADASRRLPAVTPDSWMQFARAALEALREDQPGSYAGMQVRHVALRRGGAEILVGLHQPTTLDTLELQTGEVVSGRHGAWSLLVFYDEAYHVDITDSDRERSKLLASQIASRVWGRRVEYVAAGEVFDDGLMDRLLRELTDPDFEPLPLLEIIAAVPGYTDRPLITISGPGQFRVERLVREVQSLWSFARDWRHVREVKVGFRGKYRFTMYFPHPDDPPGLTYCDRDVDKDVTRAFEAHLRESLGVVVKPRNRDAHRRWKPRPVKAPADRSESWWKGVLLPTIDSPAAWQEAALDELAERGMVTVRRVGYFRCGDPLVDHAACGVAPASCAGEIETEHGAISSGDPFELAADAELVCPSCGQVWRPRQYRLPLGLRLRVRIEHRAMFEEILRQVGEFAEVEVDPGREGVALVKFPTRRCVLVYGPLLASDAQRLQPSAQTLWSTAWIDVESSSLKEENDPHAVSLPEVLADPLVLCKRWGLPILGREPLTDPPAPPRTVQETAAAIDPSMEGKIVLRDGYVFVHGVKALAPQAHGLRMLIALLWHQAQEDRRRGRERRYLSADQLVALAKRSGLGEGDKETGISANQVYKWRMDVANKLRAAMAKRGYGVREFLEDSDAGYRLAAGYEVEGIELAHEVEKWKTRQSKRGDEPA